MIGGGDGDDDDGDDVGAYSSATHSLDQCVRM
jgi:hypothetical protein